MPDAETLAGLALAAAAATCFDGAVLLQAAEARAIAPEHGLAPSLLTRLARRRRWLAGTALAVLGWPLQLAAFALASVTLVQPTLAFGLVVLLVGGRRVLGERIGRREAVAAATIVAGVAGLALTAPDRSTAGVHPTGALVAGAALLAPVLLTLAARERARRSAAALVTGAGCAFALTSVAGKMVAVELDRGHVLAVLGWALVVAVAAVAGLLIDMSALQRYAATRVAPAMFALEIALPVAAAPAIFGESWSATPGAGAGVAASLVAILAGGAVLGARRSATAHGEHEVGRGRPAAVVEVGAER